MPGSGELGTYTFDDIALSYWLELAPVEGAQTNPIVNAISDAVDWAVGQVLGPAGDIIANALSSFASQVWAVVTGTIGWILKQAYLFERAALIGWVGPGGPTLFPQASNIYGSDPIYLTQLMARLLFEAVRGVISSAGSWVADQVKAALGYGKEFGGTLARWAWDIIDWYAHWVFNQAAAALGFGLAFGDNLASWIVRHLSGWGDWLLGQIKAGLGIVVDLGGKVVNPLTTVVNSAADWLWRQVSGLVSGIPGAIGALPGAVGKLVTDSASWLWGLISAAVSGVAGVIGALPGALGKLITASASWLWDLISKAVGAVAGVVTGLPGALGRLVTDAASWLWGLIEPKLNAIASAVISGAQELLSGLLDILKEAFTWLWEHVGEPVADEYQAKLGAINKFVNMDYDSLGQFAGDILPLSGGVPQTIFGGLALPFVLGGAALAMVGAMSTAYAQPIIREFNRKHRFALPPLAVVQESVLRGIMPLAVAKDVLAQYGYSDALIDLILEGYTRFPDPSLALELFNRHLITADMLDTALTAAGVPGGWLPSIRAGGKREIGYRQLDRIYKAGVIGADQLQPRFERQGFTADDAQLLATTVIKLGEEANRGLLDKHKDLAEGAIKGAYFRRLIPRNEALSRLAELNYRPADAEYLVSIWDLEIQQDADKRSDVNARSLGRAIIEKAYKRRLVDMNAAAAELEDMGYTPEDAKLVLQLQDLDIAGENADLEVQVAVQEYRAGLLTDAELAAQLTALHVPQARIDLLVKREVLQSSAKTARLTQAQLAAAFEAGFIGVGEFRSRLGALGYNAADIDLLVAQALRVIAKQTGPQGVAIAPPPVKKAPILSASQLKAAFKDGVIAEAEYRAGLAALGYSKRDVDILVAVAKQELL